MNDEFMTGLREAPRPEFADALYERLSKQPKPLFAPLTFRNAIIVFALLFLIAACVYAVTEKRWNKVGDIWVEVERTMKVDFTPEEMQPIPGPTECLSIEEARKILRFELHVPTRAPDGFTLDARICGIDRTSDFAGLYWKGIDESSGISLNLQNLRMFNMSTQKYEIAPATVLGPVAPRSYEEVQVHGQPAVLIHGDWEYPWITGETPSGETELKWNKKLALQLYWLEGEVLYQLNATAAADISEEDLIKMAESTQ